MPSLVVCSGKGGTGKTTVALNLALFLAQAGKRVTIVDADVAMANVGILLGVERTPLTLHNVLMGENKIRDAVYDGPNKLRFVPASLSLDRYKKLDFDRLRGAVAELEKENDWVIVDSPPGLGADAEAALKSCERALLVITPDPAALADSLKIRTLLERNAVKVSGIAVNMTRGETSEIRPADAEAVVGARVLALLPEDAEVRKATALQVPVLLKAPLSPFSRGIPALASKLAGEPLKAPEAKAKKGFLASLLSWFSTLFGRKTK